MRPCSTLISVYSVAVASWVSLVSNHAFAEKYNGVCVPDQISWDDTKTFAIHCSNKNNWYFARSYNTTDGCEAVSIDTLKAWLSMSEAAILAGKTVNINVVTADACSSIIWMQLNK